MKPKEGCIIEIFDNFVLSFSFLDGSSCFNFSQISDYYRAFDYFNKLVRLNPNNVVASNMREETLR